MTFGRELAISNLTATASNLRTEIHRHVIDRIARSAALNLLDQVLAFAIAGTEIKEAKGTRVR